MPEEAFAAASHRIFTMCFDGDAKNTGIMRVSACFIGRRCRYDEECSEDVRTFPIVTRVPW